MMRPCVFKSYFGYGDGVGHSIYWIRIPVEFDDAVKDKTVILSWLYYEPQRCAVDIRYKAGKSAWEWYDVAVPFLFVGYFVNLF